MGPRRARTTPDVVTSPHANPSLALTGWGQPEDVRRAKAAGFDHHLTKPIKPDTLITLIASLERSAAARP
jgi:CheY-like chemotaxis protein